MSPQPFSQINTLFGHWSTFLIGHSVMKHADILYQVASVKAVSQPEESPVAVVI